MLASVPQSVLHEYANNSTYSTVQHMVLNTILYCTIGQVKYQDQIPAYSVTQQFHSGYAFPSYHTDALLILVLLCCGIMVV